MYPQQVQLNESNLKKLAELYKTAYKDIVEEIKTASSFGIANRKAILRQIEKILSDLNVDVDKFIATELPKYYKKGAGQAVDQLTAIDADIGAAVRFNQIHREAIAALVDDTQKAFAESLQGVGRSATKLLGKATREALTQQIALGKVGGDALREVKKTIVATLEQEGLSALIDKSGKTWELETYAEMLIRTKAVEARNRGMANRMVENGYDLVQVSAHGATDVCGKWEGKILSVSGQTPGYPTVSEAEGDGLFHPNCKHAINALRLELARETMQWNADTGQYEKGIIE